MAILPEGAGPCPRCGCSQQPGPWVPKGHAICRCTDHEKEVARQRRARPAITQGQRFRMDIAGLRGSRDTSVYLLHRGPSRVALCQTAKDLIKYDRAICAEQKRRIMRHQQSGESHD